MKTTTGIIAAAVLLFALLPATASAHGGHGKKYNGHYHGHYKGYHQGYYRAPVRSKRMPGWLYHNRHFRVWYRHSDVKYNRYLSWRKVHRIYQRQMARRYHRYEHHYGRENRQYERYDDDRPRRRRGG